MDAIAGLLGQRIEKDLLDLMNDALPVRALEVLERVSVEDPKTARCPDAGAQSSESRFARRACLDA